MNSELTISQKFDFYKKKFLEKYIALKLELQVWLFSSNHFLCRYSYDFPIMWKDIFKNFIVFQDRYLIMEI